MTDPTHSKQSELDQISVQFADVLPYAVYGKSFDMLNGDEKGRILVAHVEMCKQIQAYADHLDEVVKKTCAELRAALESDG